ncbi:MAG: response regulator [Acidobacteriaceae bacterium]
MPNLKASLLVVDDEPTIRKTLFALLSALGYAVRSAPNGFSALDALRDEIPDLLLCDLYMPGMSGFELLSIVRRRFPSVRVIAMSAAFSGMAVPPGVAADAFYEKGKRPSLLLRIVQTMMRPPRSLVVHPPRSNAPIWIPTNGHNTSGEPYVLISCPECLRAFPQIPDKSAATLFDTKCAWCSSPIHYAIVHSPDPASTQRPAGENPPVPRPPLPSDYAPEAAGT